MTDGTLRVEVSGRKFDKTRLGKLLQKTYPVTNGLANVILGVPTYTETLNFKVTVYYIYFVIFFVSQHPLLVSVSRYGNKNIICLN